MESIKQWAVTVSVTTIISGILLSVIPGGKLRKGAEFFVCLLVLVCFFAPLAGSGGIELEPGSARVEEFEYDTSELEKNISDSVISYVADEMAGELIACAAQKGITLENVRAELSYDDAGNVSVTRITVHDDIEQYWCDSVTDIAKKLFGEEVQVGFESE